MTTKKKGYNIAMIVGRGALLLCLALLALACATKPESYKEIDLAVEESNFEVAVDTLKAGQEAKKPLYPEKNTIMLYLDKAMLEHYAGRTDDSIESFKEGERLIEEAFTKSVSADLMSYIANDNTKDYPGEDFEDIYINVFNALNFYKKGDLDGALVEIRKLSLSSGKLDMLSRKYEGSSKSFGEKVLESLDKIGFKLNDALPEPGSINFANSALARYLAALFYLGDGNTDGARIEFDMIPEAYAGNTNIYTTSVPASVADARSVPADKARLNVISFAGLSPVKIEEKYTQNWPFMTVPELQKPTFKLPNFTDRPSVIDSIEMVVGSEKVTLDLLEDMGAVMKETFRARFSNMFFKTYIRVLLKYATVEVAAQQAGGAGDLKVRLAAIAAQKVLDATEGADIRMSRYLPAKAYIGGINLDPGTYDVTINFLSGGSNVATVEHSGVDVKAGVLNLIDAVSLK